MVVNDALRRDQGELSDADSISAGEMLRAMALYRQMRAGPEFSEADLAAVAATVEAAQQEPPREVAGDAVVTPIDVSRKRGDGPVRG